MFGANKAKTFKKANDKGKESESDNESEAGDICDLNNSLSKHSNSTPPRSGDSAEQTKPQPPKLS